MARTVVATDNFNRANAALATDWAQLNAVGAGNAQIVGNAIAGTVSGSTAAARRITEAFSDDQYSSLVISSGDTGTASYGMGVIARASGDIDGARDYYYVFVSNQTVFGKVLNGTDTPIASSAAPSWSAGDRVELECEGTTIRVMKNGVALGGAFTVTDASLTTGKPGVAPRGDPGVVTGDDWEGGNLGSPPPPPSNFVPRRSMKIWAYA